MFLRELVKALRAELKRLGSASADAARMVDEMERGTGKWSDGREIRAVRETPLAEREVAL